MKKLLSIVFLSCFFHVPLSFSETRIALILDKGGKDDKSFNSAAYRGLLKAEKDFKVQTKLVEATDDNAFEPLLRSFAKKKFDLIIAVGVSQAESVKKVAKLEPEARFVVVDAEIDLPNVLSLVFEEQEGSFLVGAIAAMKTTTGKVGFIGGMDIPLIRRFEMGYAAGAKHINSKMEVIANYVGVSGEAWNNPTRAKELALSQYQKGADIIFSAAGASGQGIFDAAEEKKKFAIGVDSNQNGIKPGRILTSMLKKVDEAVYRACESASQGKFQAGLKREGLATQGIDFALDANNEKLLTAADLKKIDSIKKDIISKKIKVPDYYKKNAH